jgi:hypothetical protein
MSPTSLARPTALAIALVAVACSSKPGEDAASGSVETALSAVGPDGATYSLPATAVLTLTHAGGSPDAITLSSTKATQSFDVPAGAYTATLASGATDAGAPWTLTRAGDGGATSIPAQLVDPQPYALTVTAGATTPLVFHFLTDALGPVTFQTGTIGTSLQIDAGAFPVTSGRVTGTASLSVESLSGPPAFDSALRFNGSASVPYVLGLARTGPWALSADMACAPVSVTASSTATRAGLAALVAETSGGSGNLCFGDTNVTGQLTLTTYRTGTPLTPTMKAALPAGGTFELSLSGYAPEVLAGGVLNLAKLGEPFTVTNVGLSEVVSSGGSMLADVSGAPTGTATVTLQP